MASVLTGGTFRFKCGIVNERMAEATGKEMMQVVTELAEVLGVEIVFTCKDWKVQQ
jgi:hypothetical protein